MRGWLRGNAYALLRVALGLVLLRHGLPQAVGGWTEWARVGSLLLAPFGIAGFHVAAGLFNTFCLCIGGAGLVLGLLFPPAVCLAAAAVAGDLILVLRRDWLPPDPATASDALVAAVANIRGDGPLLGLFLIMFLYLLVEGPGPGSLDRLIAGRPPPAETPAPPAPPPADTATETPSRATAATSRRRRSAP
jgi:uncharacterized membrane protein YphA (DoxX/SURF4 family)